MTPLLVIFLLVFFTEVIAWIGKGVLLELALAGYLRLFYSSTTRKQRKIKTELLSTKAELLKTSAQDQFAKWAKLRRSVDKGLADLETLNSEISSIRTSFSFKFSSFLWILTTGLQFFVGWWYRKAPVFYLPPGWFGPLGWILALPFAPTDSVSVGVWSMACKRVVRVGERVVRELASSSTGAETDAAAQKQTTDEKKSE